MKNKIAYIGIINGKIIARKINAITTAISNIKNISSIFFTIKYKIIPIIIIGPIKGIENINIPKNNNIIPGINLSLGISTPIPSSFSILYFKENILLIFILKLLKDFPLQIKKINYYARTSLLIKKEIISEFLSKEQADYR